MARSTKHAARRKTRAARIRKTPAPVAGAPGGIPEKRAKTAAAFVGTAKGNKTAAMKKAGYSTTTAEHGQSAVFGDPRVQGEIKRLLEDAGLTDAVVVKRHREALDAVAEKFFKTEKIGDLTDHHTRLDAVALYYELTGRIKRGVEINVVVQQWTEYVLQIVKKYVTDDKRQACLDEIIRELSTPGRN